MAVSWQGRGMMYVCELSFKAAGERHWNGVVCVNQIKHASEKSLVSSTPKHLKVDLPPPTVERSLTLWRRSFFLKIFSHPVFKM
jgi:hypothetical protein